MSMCVSPMGPMNKMMAKTFQNLKTHPLFTTIKNNKREAVIN